MNRVMGYTFATSESTTASGDGVVTIRASSNEEQDRKVLLLRAKTLEAKKNGVSSSQIKIDVKQVSLEENIMQNPTVRQATAGEIKLFNTFQGKRIAAVYGTTDKGTGWRPVCRGHLLGGSVHTTESEAIRHGKKYMADLKNRVQAAERSHAHAITTSTQASEGNAIIAKEKPAKKNRNKREAAK